MARYIQIEDVSPADKNKVRQDLKYRTSKFVWKVAFSEQLDPQSVSNDTVTVTTKQKQPIMTNISYNASEKCIEIEPLEAYSENESYILHISQKVQAKSGKYLSRPVNVQFKI